MATLKQRLHRKNATGYDVIHFETESSLVLRPSGRTVEQDLEDYLPKVQDDDTVPDTLKSGQSVYNQNRVYVGVNNTVEGLILQSDNPLSYEESGTSTDIPPYEGSDADSLGGHSASEYLLKTEAQTIYAPIVHTHSMDQITGLTDSLTGKAAASHTHAASQVTAGKFAGVVTAAANIAVGTQAIRNIYAGTSDIGAGASLATGVIYLVYE